jgi:hypothetical protein
MWTSGVATFATSEFDSWLTIDADLDDDGQPDSLGRTDLTPVGISSADFSGWTASAGLTVTDGAVVYFSE